MTSTPNGDGNDELPSTLTPIETEPYTIGDFAWDVMMVIVSSVLIIFAMNFFVNKILELWPF